MYPKDRLPGSKAQCQMPPNLVTLFAHVMSRANESCRGSASHTWSEVLLPMSPSAASSSSSSSSGSTSPGPIPFPMSSQDWRKAEAFSLHLQSLIAARLAHCTSSSESHGQSAREQQRNGVNATSFGSSCKSSASLPGVNGDQAWSTSSATPSNAVATPAGKHLVQANGKARGSRTKQQSAATAQTVHTGSAVTAATAGAATPNPGATWQRHQGHRVTPKEPSRSAGEPSAPTKVAGRVAASRRVNGVAEGAIASLAVSHAGPGAFDTPRHTPLHHTVGLSGAPMNGNHLRDRENSPSRYPARLRSRRFPQLEGTGGSPELSQHQGRFGHGGEASNTVSDADDQAQTGRRFSPRGSSAHSVARGHGGRAYAADNDDHYHQHQHSPRNRLDEAAVAAPTRSKGVAVLTKLAHDDNNGHVHGREDQSCVMRTRGAVPKAAHGSLEAAMASPLASPSGACTPTVGMTATGAGMPEMTAASPAPMEFRLAPPPILSSASAIGPSPWAGVAAKPRQVLQRGGGRAGTRAAPVPRSSVGGRNYTDNHVKQLGLIEAAVVASATAKDRATYNLPRQGRTLTLTNVFKFVALRGAGAMYRLAMQKQVEAHTGRHSNFFDGKIDARIVGVIKRDINDEAITKSRKFSKILLSLVAEGCSHPDCDWDHTSFTSDKIANYQARIEAENGTSALKICSDPFSPEHASTAAAAAAAAAAALPAAASSIPGPSSPPGPGTIHGGGSSNGATKGAPSKRRLDLGRDDDRQKTPSPRMKKMKRATRVRLTGVESTPTGATLGIAKSPPKEEDDMRAAEVLQGLKGIGGSSG